MLDALSDRVLSDRALRHDERASRSIGLSVRFRGLTRRLLGWSILSGWIVLPLLPGLGWALSRFLGLGLF